MSLTGHKDSALTDDSRAAQKEPVPGKELPMNEKKNQVKRLQQYRTLLAYLAKQKERSRDKE